ncbi:hypothetical protein FJT64_004821 [Amphibalanus amphitrite]|uniref:Uncharacterized protein n=1 Tax=Amphibalanus amphitrite TaxID=1232801 RepID=A0A6A4VVS9_AMPAM|nr:hypothetical protein FJT64_004821 [Amphibalanus amphitrite]
MSLRQQTSRGPFTTPSAPARFPARPGDQPCLAGSEQDPLPTARLIGGDVIRYQAGVPGVRYCCRSLIAGLTSNLHNSLSVEKFPDRRKASELRRDDCGPR